MFRILIFLSVVLSGKASAFTLKSFEYYRDNPTQKTIDLISLGEMNLDKENARLGREIFHEMDRIHVLSLNFSELNSIVQSKKWPNILREASLMANSCNVENIESGYCEKAMISFKSFVMGSNLNEDNRQLILNPIVRLQEELSSQLTIKNNQLTKINTNLQLMNSQLLSFEKAKGHTVVPLTSQNISKIDFLDFKTIQSLLIVCILLFLLVLFCLTLFHYILRRKIQNFYSLIFFISKKNNYKTKIIGLITPGNWKSVRHIEGSIITMLNVAKGIANFKEFKFKSNKLFVIVEMTFLSSTSIENIINGNAPKKFSDAISKLKNDVEKTGGEFLLQTTYNQSGDIGNSVMVVYLPK